MPSSDSHTTTNKPANAFDASATLLYFRSLSVIDAKDRETTTTPPVAVKTPSVSSRKSPPSLSSISSSVYRVQTGFDPREHFSRYSSYSHSPAGGSFLTSSSSRGFGGGSPSSDGVGGLVGGGVCDADLIDGFLTLAEEDLVIKLRSLSLLEVPDVFPTKDCSSSSASSPFSSAAWPIPGTGCAPVDAQRLVNDGIFYFVRDYIVTD